MMKTTNTLLKRNRIIKLLKESIESKIIYLSAPIGCGKTIAVKQFIKATKYDFMIIDCSKKEEINKLNSVKNKYFVLENFNKIDEKDKEIAINFIDNSDDNFHFIINSRKPVEKKLKKFFYESNLVEIYKEDLNFTKNETYKLYQLNGVNLSTHDLDEIYNDIKGLAIVTNLLIMYLKENHYSKEIYKRVERSFFEYINYNIFKNFDTEILQQLIIISFLKNINTKTVNYILNIENAHEKLELFENNGSFLLKKSNGEYELLPIVVDFLQDKAFSEFSNKKIENVYLKIARYYEEEKNTFISSEYYVLANKFQKAAELLQKEDIQHLGIIDYKAIEKCIIKIPEKIIENNPQLCITLAHIYRINSKSFEQKKWFERFEQIKEKEKKNNNEYSYLEQLEIYYKICQPEVNDIKLIDYVKVLSKVNDSQSPLNNITFTGNQPSIMSGGKDLSNWGKHYKIMYLAMTPLILRVFKDRQQGAGEIAIAELLYQKNEFEESIKYLMKGISKCSNIDNLFVANSLLNKIKLNKNYSNDDLNNFGEKIKEEKAWYLLPNYKARLIENEILNGNKIKVEEWLEQENIDIVNNFNNLKRFQYFTLARAYIMLEKNTEAIIVLERLENYIKKYNRIVYKIEDNILKSICFYKEKNDIKSLEYIEKAIIEAQQYKYIRLFADEGIIVYKILMKYKKNLSNNYKINAEFFNEIINQSKIYGKLYPNKYNLDKTTEVLTKRELEMIKLICIGKSNKEISEDMNISIATVKTHINHIYNKLEAKNRVQIINIVQKKNLLEDWE